ncbi:MAG: glycosyltransferase [Selenomonadaceae bacterium]|nr:glycosyltransferase [Selenomonadaceae bacterium]
MSAITSDPVSGARKHRLSIVVPVYNEEANLRHFYAAVCHELAKLPQYAWELIFVDDGSVDKSRAILHELEQEDCRVQPMLLARNSGHQLALTCGLDHADGDVVITMDGDMQHPPEMIPTLLRDWEEGYEVVQTIREATEDASWLKRTTSAGYYRFLNIISEVPVQPGGSDFRLMDHKVVVAFRRYREHARFIRGLVGSMGFRQKQVHFTAPPRYAGVSKFSPRKMWRLAVDGVFTCSTFPLRIGLYIGFFSMMVSLILFLHVLFETFVREDTVAGWPTIIACIAFFGGLQLMILGIIGEYLGRTYEEAKHRPLYLLERGKPADCGQAAPAGFPPAVPARAASQEQEDGNGRQRG